MFLRWSVLCENGMERNTILMKKQKKKKHQILRFLHAIVKSKIEDYTFKTESELVFLLIKMLIFCIS